MMFDQSNRQSKRKRRRTVIIVVTAVAALIIGTILPMYAMGSEPGDDNIEALSDAAAESWEPDIFEIDSFDGFEIDSFDGDEDFSEDYEGQAENDEFFSVPVPETEEKEEYAAEQEADAQAAGDGAADDIEEAEETETESEEPVETETEFEEPVESEEEYEESVESEAGEEEPGKAEPDYEEPENTAESVISDDETENNPEDSGDEELQETEPRRMTAAGPAAVGIPEYVENSMMQGMHYADAAANEWQTDAEHYRYQGNSAAYKVQSDDGAVRVQKNVIPTGVENEFLIYLSVDYSQTLVIQKIINGIGTVYTPSNPMPSYGDIWNEGNAAKAQNAMVTGKDGNMRAFMLEKSEKYDKTWILRFTLPGGEVLMVTRYAEFDSFNNGHLVMKISSEPAPSGTWITVGSAAKANAYGPDGEYIADIILDENAVQVLLGYEGIRLDLGTVYDGMGEQAISFAGVESYTGWENADISITGGEPEGNDPGLQTSESDPGLQASGDSIVLEWNLGTAFLSGMTQDGYYTNVAECLYKITLDVTEDEFVSGKWYNTNKDTVLYYMKEDGTSGTVAFPDPAVRGSVYSLSFEKVDEDGEALAGAEFMLTGPQENPDVGSWVRTCTTMGMPDEVITFGNLPWGKYTLTEMPPAGYQAAEEAPWEMYIGYTGDGSEVYGHYLTPAAGEDVGPDGALWLDPELAEDGVWRIVNKEEEISGFELPNTGGPGRFVYVLAGIVLITAAAVAGGIKMKSL